MVQTQQDVRHTKPRTTPEASEATSSPPTPYPVLPTKEMHINEKLISKLYTEDMGRFPIRSCSGNLYIMLAYHCYCNVILVKPLRPKHDRYRLSAYNNICRHIKQRIHGMNLQILDN